MASTINIKVTSNFDEASKMLREFGSTTEAQKAKVQAFVDSFKTEKVDQFMDKNTRAAAAVRATQGPMQALTTEHRNLQREIERLIKNGLDPQDEALKPLIQRYQQLEKELEDNARAQTATEKVSAITAASFLYIAKTAINAGKKVYDFSKQFIDAASSAEEGENKFNAVFGSIQSTATETAEALAESYGMSERASMDMLSATGDLLTGLGLTADESLRLAEQAAALGTDLASFSNYSGGAEGAVDALRKAMLGETEAAKALGLVLNETQLKEYAEKQGKVVSELTLAEKAQMRLNMAMEQSKNAIGDFERSQDSYANQTRIAKAAVEDLKVEIGEHLLPAATRAVSMFGELAGAVRDFIRERDALKAMDQYWTEGVQTQNELQRAYSATASKLAELRTTLEELQSSEERTRGNTAARLRVRDQEVESVQKEIQSLETLLSWLEEEQRLKAEAVTAEQKLAVARETAAAEATKWTDERIRQQVSLKSVFAQIEEQEKLFGDAFDDRAAKETAVRKALQEMIAFGFTAEGDGIRRVMDEYGEYLEQLETAAGEKEKLTWDEIQSYLDKNSYAEQWHDAEMNRIRDEAEAAEELAKKRKAAATDMYDSLTGLASAYFDYERSVYEQKLEVAKATYGEESEAYALYKEEAAKEYQEIRLKQFNWDKGTSALETGIHGATAAVRAYADLGWPAGAIAAAVVGGLTAAKVGFILAQKPPTFQTGTMPSGYTVPESASSRGDSQLIRVNPGERVDVTPRGETSPIDQTLNIFFDGEKLVHFINKRIVSGEIRLGKNLA